MNLKKMPPNLIEEGNLVSVPAKISLIYFFREELNLQLALERSLNLKSEILSLNRAQLRQLCVDVGQVELGDGLIQDLRENVNTNIELLSLAELNVLLAKCHILGLEQQDLSKNLVGE